MMERTDNKMNAPSVAKIGPDTPSAHYKKAIFDIKWTIFLYQPCCKFKIRIHLGGMTSTRMQDWNIDGNKVGSYYMATVLNKVSQLQDIRTVEGKFVRRWDKKTIVNGTKIGGLFYAKSVMLATGHAERMTRAQQRHWLKRLNNTIAPSLQHVPYGKKASSMSVFGLFCGQLVHYTCITSLLCRVKL